MAYAEVHLLRSSVQHSELANDLSVERANRHPHVFLASGTLVASADADVGVSMAAWR
jgi:hypothetical protein